MNYLKKILFVALIFITSIANAKQLKHIQIIDVVLKENATNLETEYAKHLMNFLQKKFPKLYINLVNHKYYTGNNYKIFLENTPSISENNSNLKDIKQDTIEITSNEKFTKISYANNTSVGFAVGTFLDKFISFKYLTPAEIGEEYKQDKYFNINIKNYKITPSYINRFYGIYQRNTHLYSRLSGENAILNLPNHYISKTTMDISIKENPNFFPIISGERRDYSYSKNIQMNYLDKEFQSHIAKNVIDYFQKHNSAKVYSITYADSFLFDQSQETQSLISGYSPTGYANYSNVVFKFTNAVSKMVAKKYPNKYVGELAYLYTEPPPLFKLNNNIVIYLCADRTNYYNKNLRKIDLNLQKAWSKSGVKLWGIYNYIYGGGYVIPSNTIDSISDSIKSCYNLGGRLYTCETYPVWAYDAHKMYIMTNLLNDVNIDAKKLEKQFFKDYYKEASSYIEEFFEIAKSAWKNRNETPIWLKAFRRTSQLDIFTKDEILKMQEALIKAEHTNTSAKVQQRIYEIRLVFDITKANFDIYSYQKYFANFKAESIADCYIALDKIEALKIATTIKKLSINSYNKNTKYPKSNFDFIGNSNFINMLETTAEKIYNTENKELQCKIKSIFGDKFCNKIESIKKSELISKNPNFKQGFQHWIKFNPLDNIKIFEATENNSLKASSQNFLGITQYANIVGGNVYALNANFKGKLNSGNVAYIRLNFLDAKGNRLESNKQQLPTNTNKLNTLRIVAKAPPNAVRCSFSLFVGIMSIDETIEIEKFELRKAINN